MPSSLVRDVAVAAAAAVALAAAFPKIGAAWIVPFGTAALFWTWQGASWKRAALLGWFSGIIFFAIAFDWIGHTVGSYIGAYGPFLMFGPAIVEAPYWGFAGIACVLAYRYAHPSLAPLAAAAAFTVFEWLRSIGIMAAPFDQLGYTQADSPMRAIAAFIGTYGITFALCIVGAYGADAIRRRTWRPFAAAVSAVVVVSAVAWIAWPARHLPEPTTRVAAIQGNIAQSLKWNSLNLAISRYSILTRTAAAKHPQLIVWPETVITTDLNRYPALLRAFLDLSRESGATIVAGSVEVARQKAYNALFVLQPNGTYQIYRKRQLVPFAESFPGRSFLGWLPYVGELSGRFGTGNVNGVYKTTALPVAPLICWESAFADLAYAQIAAGAQLLVVSTDDAWFGTTSGPYMHAQISQLRAVETGAYVVRAAATGISGIIAPDGTWQRRSAMEEMVTVDGRVGPRVPTVFSRIGPTPVGIALVVLYAAIIVLNVPYRRARAASEALSLSKGQGDTIAQGDTVRQ
ncbi:MAG TPA: apolipoprotein N-acyltransferase [Candidatus Baltobacteraceae bacterium]|nr:apolipoprotein N-acyltransferase [Candidatus Baltobacteraceae bacterium]